MLVGVGSDLRYLTGYEAMPLERLTLLVLRPGSAPDDRRPAARARSRRGRPADADRDRTWDETDDPYALAVAGIPAAGRVAVSDTMLAMHLLRIQAALGPEYRVRPRRRAVLRDLRMVKDADEIALLRAAAHAADRVVAADRRRPRSSGEPRRTSLARSGTAWSTKGTMPRRSRSSPPGRTRRRHITRHRSGSSAAGEPIVLDIGGTLSGYGSDITRTLWVTGGDPAKDPDERFRHLFNVLQAAQASATRAVRPGVACAAIDAAARSVIEGEGHGDAFFHRTGHGIGLDGHEDPYLVAGNDLALRAGMAFSVEPGIYYPGGYGARIEDIVVCGEDGPIVLNEAPRELAVVAG